MAAINLWTYKDMLDHVNDYLGANPSDEAYKAGRRAVQAAYREFSNTHRWSYYYRQGRLLTVQQQLTGTVQYIHTGGAYERQMTLTGATWPTWAGFGTVLINNIPYEVAERKSDTVLTMTLTMNPGADLPAGMAYTLYRATYPLPADFLATDTLSILINNRPLLFIPAGRWQDQIYFLKGPSIPRTYTIRGDPHYIGAMAVSFHPPPDAIYTIDFLYQRRPRPLLIDQYQTGTATCTQGLTSVTGTGVAWTSAHIGSVLRFAADASQNYPTSLVGTNPAAVERTVLDVPTNNTITLDMEPGQTCTGVKYVLSDPVDIEDGVMMEAFERCLEKQATAGRIMKNRPDAALAYKEALIRAREADSRSFQQRVAGWGVSFRERLANMPRGADVP